MLWKRAMLLEICETKSESKELPEGLNYLTTYGLIPCQPYSWCVDVIPSFKWHKHVSWWSSVEGPRAAPWEEGAYVKMCRGRCTYSYRGWGAVMVVGLLNDSRRTEMLCVKHLSKQSYIMSTQLPTLSSSGYKGNRPELFPSLIRGLLWRRRGEGG